MTIFEKIIAREIPAHVVFENERVLAFQDISPQAETHVLVIPKKKAKDFLELCSWEEVEIGSFFKDVAEVAKKLGIDKSGFRTVMNTGVGGGQSVFYVHAHLLAGDISGSFA